MLTLACAALLVGLIALVIGVRGRRVGTEPWCRECGFDLSGLIERGERTCPECGRDVSAPGATVTGRRWRPPMAWGFGVALLIAGASLAFVASQRVHWIPNAPSRVLALYTRWSGKDAALDELIARLEAQTLSGASIDDVVAAALDAQADLATPWNVRWGAFVEKASLKGRVSSARERVYLDHVVNVASVRSRPSSISGWQLPVQVNLDIRRGGVRGVHIKNVLTADLKGFEASRSPFLGGGFELGEDSRYRAGESVGTGMAGGPVPLTPAAPSGEHTLQIEYRWWTFWAGLEPASYELTEQKMPPISGRWSEARPVRVASNAHEIVTRVVAAATEQALSATALGVIMRHQGGPAYTTRTARDGTRERFKGAFPAEVGLWLELDEVLAGQPGLAAFDVYVVADDGAEQWLARVALQQSEAQIVQGMASIPAEIKNVTIVLKPSSEAMLTSVESGSQLALDELVIEGVPVVSGYPQHAGLQGAHEARKKDGAR